MFPIEPESPPDETNRTEKPEEGLDAEHSSLFPSVSAAFERRTCRAACRVRRHVAAASPGASTPPSALSIR
ncbi:hypothetical protein EYF80_055908 [Liparis tanakae]|uniref:Uncharacterized protein n=1 Tax=Liparis tanakae TaxID=230148 RepID=A0A4Z2EZB4_9TELE|nr:hypothetical protein EYF80_055908 [Liparis tanakae]